MSKTVVRRVLLESSIVKSHDVSVDEEMGLYVIKIVISPPAETSDLGEIIKIKNNLRKQIPKAYRMKFEITFVA